MVDSDDGEYFHDYDILVNKGPRRNDGRRRLFDRYAGKKVSDQVVFAKTLYDPENTLSKRERRRLLRDRSDGFGSNVIYSLNKRNRWKSINPASILGNHPADEPGIWVLYRGFGHFLAYCENPYTFSITDAHIRNGDSITTFSSSGRKKRLQYFINASKAIQEKGNEVEPARIHYNIVEPTRAARFKKAVFRTGRKPHTQLDKQEVVDYGLEDVWDDWPDHIDDLSRYECFNTKETAKRITVEDFICGQLSTSSRKSKGRLVASRGAKVKDNTNFDSFQVHALHFG
ncbi:hypothetical protein Y032_0638g966 [Ancylostoma ceylanicum]|uniref:Uncharacterized protein n=1 Tax=Ancylostoma ceylanicum TaxID=53326 RepID=A0A016WJ40_9BILA|nr:hypothetical protein Y032_0638g966 [Ancylostoma ceylanicum]